MAQRQQRSGCGHSSLAVDRRVPATIRRWRFFFKADVRECRFDFLVVPWAVHIDQPAHYGVIREYPLETLIQTRNWVGEGWSAQRYRKLSVELQCVAPVTPRPPRVRFRKR